MAKRKAPPWRFVSGAPAGYRKLKNRITGKTRLVKMGGGKARKTRRNPSHYERQGMPALKVTRNDGSHYITSMAKGVTLSAAKKYFLGQTQVSEDQETGKETRLKVVSIEQIKTNPATFRRLPSGPLRVPTKYQRIGLRKRMHAAALRHKRRLIVGDDKPITPSELIKSMGRGPRARTVVNALNSMMKKIHLEPWRPPGWRKQSRVRISLPRERRPIGGNMIFGIRHGHRWTLKSKPVGGKIIARGLSDGAMRKRARAAGYHIRSM